MDTLEKLLCALSRMLSIILMYTGLPESVHALPAIESLSPPAVVCLCISLSSAAAAAAAAVFPLHLNFLLPFICLFAHKVACDCRPLEETLKQEWSGGQRLNMC